VFLWPAASWRDDCFAARALNKSAANRWGGGRV
jgi:hypothetical protein